MNNQYVPLEGKSLSVVGIETPTFGAGESAGSLLTTSTFIYSLLFTVVIVGAFYRYVIAGVYRMQASEFSIRKSNEIIKQVTLGLLGVFSLFLILFTINKDLVTGDVTLDSLRSALPVGGGTQSNSSSTGSGSVLPPITGLQPGPSNGDPLKQDPSVRASLTSMNITVNKPVCATLTSTGCTTVGGIHQSTLEMLQKLRSTCSGSIVITGGTEAGHNSHGPGLTPVDLRIGDSALDSCIRSFSNGPQLRYCNKTFTNFGYVFCDEKGSHWHVYK